MRNHKILLLVISLLLSSCRTNFIPLKPDEPIQIDPEQGFLLMRIDSSSKNTVFIRIGSRSPIITNSLYKILIRGATNGVFSEQFLQEGRFLLIPLAEGHYEFQKVEMNDFPTNSYIKLKTTETQSWEFDVKAGQINYIGDFRFRVQPDGIRVVVEMANRSSYALEYMEQNFPKLLERYAIRYTGFGKDRFLEINHKPSIQVSEEPAR